MNVCAYVRVCVREITSLNTQYHNSITRRRNFINEKLLNNNQQDDEKNTDVLGRNS